MRLRGLVCAVLGLCLLLGSGLASAGGEGGGAWAERVQILYDDAARSVSRARIRVWDPEPAKNLDFVWEPESGQPGAGLLADGTVEGRGTLVWRVRGSASYDPRTVHSLYKGQLRNGLPHGQGRLERRVGEIMEGSFAEGVLNGDGVHVDTAGNRYEGGFRNGRPHGKGRLLAATGEIFEGSFADGARHGEGRTLLPGGTAYASVYRYGEEVSTDRPAVFADATLGGLLRAEGGGGAAGKVEISVVVDQRMTQRSDMRYQHLVREEDIAIYPEEDEMNAAWNGDGEITTADWHLGSVDWQDAPAYVQIGVATTDRSRVRLESFELQVDESEAYRKPMLSLESHIGCVGFRPSFSFLNHGWGDVEDGMLTLRFTGDTYDDPDIGESREFSLPVGSFSDGADVSVLPALQEAGVDTAMLEGERFHCPSYDQLAICRSQLFNQVGFGEIDAFVWGNDRLSTTAVGRFDYSWSDDYGNSYQESEGFQIDVALATIEMEQGLAECGDGFSGPPEALRYQAVHLPVGEADYAVPIAVRGNRNIRDYTARLKISADMSSFHSFRAVAGFDDGSVRQSKPVSLFYYRPNPSTYRPAEPAMACYLPPEFGGC